MTALVLWHRLFRCKHARAKRLHEMYVDGLRKCADCDVMLERVRGC